MSSSWNHYCRHHHHCHHHHYHHPHCRQNQIYYQNYIFYQSISISYSGQKKIKRTQENYPADDQLAAGYNLLIIIITGCDEKPISILQTRTRISFNLILGMRTTKSFSHSHVSKRERDFHFSILVFPCFLLTHPLLGIQNTKDLLPKSSAPSTNVKRFSM